MMSKTNSRSSNKHHTFPPCKRFNFLRKNKNSRFNPDRFIMNLHQKQIVNGVSNDNKLLMNDQRRVAFISLIGLFQTYKKCPAAILYSSIFILPLQKKWIYFPIKYKNEIKQSIIGQMNISDDQTAFNDFLELLKWKDSQNLIFWMLDEHNHIHDADVIAPFWKDFSKKLTTLYDPITKSNYKPIQLSPTWWKDSYGKVCASKYDVQGYKILKELFFVTMQFKCLKEILYQSNPNSFNPIVSYVSNPTANISSTTVPLFKSPKKDSQLKPVFVESSIVERSTDCHGFVAFDNVYFADINKNINNATVNKNKGGVWMISTDYLNEINE